jgi:hypothetical protein
MRVEALPTIAEPPRFDYGRAMAVEHMVFFRFRDEIPQARRVEYARALKALTETIPGIVRLAVGENFTARALGAQLGLVLTVESKAALDAYQSHPSHVAVAQGLRADCDQILALDFEHGCGAEHAHHPS